MICDNETNSDSIEYSSQESGPNSIIIYNFVIKSKNLCFSKPQDCVFVSKNQRFDLTGLRAERWTAYDTRSLYLSVFLSFPYNFMFFSDIYIFWLEANHS